MPTFDNELENDIEPVKNETVQDVKIESINDAIKNVIKKSMGADGKHLLFSWDNHKDWWLIYYSSNSTLFIYIYNKISKI